MMELPEAVAIAAQMDERVRGKVIESAGCGNSPHKWAFYNPPKASFPKALAGKTVCESSGVGNSVATVLDPGFVLMQGDGGLRILLHEAGAALPKKRHLQLTFTDGTCLTTAIAGWGFFRLIKQSDLAGHVTGMGISPLGDAFTYAAFKGLVAACAAAGKDSVKKFLITSGGLCGIGNGYAQDIAFRARLHPRRKMADLAGREVRKLYHAITRTVKEAVRLGGRDTEFGLDGSPGRYRPILDKRAKGAPCPECGAEIEKIQYLGGSCYFCPVCQAQA